MPTEQALALATDIGTTLPDASQASDDQTQAFQLENRYPDAFSVLRFIKGNKSKGIELSPSGI